MKTEGPAMRKCECGCWIKRHVPMGEDMICPTHMVTCRYDVLGRAKK